MKKAIGTAVYNPTTNELYNLTINHNDINITLINHEHLPKTNPYKFTTFKALYQTVLLIAKNNGFLFKTFNAFGTTFYNIQWIESEKPLSINIYPYKQTED